MGGCGLVVWIKMVPPSAYCQDMENVGVSLKRDP